MKKFVLYAAVFGKKASFRKPIISGLDMDKVLYTDLPGLINEDHVFYDVRRKNLDNLDQTRRNRFMKINIPDEIFYNYEYSLYMDYKHLTAINFDDMLGQLEPGSDFLITKHKQRDCVYKEGAVCIERNKGNKEEILKQLSHYLSKGYPSHNGLYAAWWLFRRHTKELKELMKLWWQQVDKYSYRDQISLPYIAWKEGLKISLDNREK